MNPSRSARLSEVFVELADTMVDEFDLVEFLTRLAGYYVELFPADEAGVVLADGRDGLRVLASSSERMRMLELHEVHNDEGPGLDAYRTGKVVANVDLAGVDGQWARFAPQARGEGFEVAHAFPMRLRGDIVVVISVLSLHRAHLDPDELQIAQALADVATIAILQERAVRESRMLAEQLQRALVTRVAIEQAKGVLAERLGLEMPAAFERLRGYARRHNLLVGDVARHVASGELSSDELGAGEHPDSEKRS